ncbi:hypothetical protein [Campylobacter concisus]|jgi:hypothetical protein|uniref:hypothetical protein n=1 Tax=Campylobacter concisus TaxID=199 RepID=UPI000CD897B2|nr:hypothetical protein [Campylobacter concisus]
MPYFNPNKVDFNYNTNTIDAVGATGRALWDIYQDSVRNNFTKQRLAEENRSNLAQENYNNKLFDANEAWRQNQIENQEKDRAWKMNTDARDFALKEKQINAQIDANNENRAFNQWYKNQMLLDRQAARQASQEQKDIGLKMKMQADEDEVSALAEANADSPYLAGQYGALNPDGTIDKDKFVKTLVAQYKTNPKAAVAAINKSLAEKKALDANLAQSNTIKTIATLKEQLNQIPEDKKLDDYDGLVDKIGDNINALMGRGADKKAAEAILATLNNLGFQNMRVGKADAERKDFDKEYKVELDSVIADNDKFSQAQKLQGITIPAAIKELELKRDSVSNQYAKQRYQKEINEANEVNKRLDKFFSKSANTSTKNYNNVTEY